MKKYIKHTKEFKTEVIEYAKQTSFWAAAKKYNIKNATVEYWVKPIIRERMSKRAKEDWKIKSQDPEFIKQWNEKSKQDRKDRPEYYKALGEVYRNNNREKVRAWTRNHRLNNLEHYKKLMKVVYEKDKVSGRAAERRKDPIFQLKRGIRESDIRALEYGQLDKESHTGKHLGCDIYFFRSYIENQFKPGMTWDNRGRTHILGERAWHLDHKLPLALLSEDASEEMLAKLCHYTNHQPLWEDENLEKSDNLDWEDAELSIIEEEIYSGNFHPSLLND